MRIPCPKCGESVTVNGLGRKPLDIVVTKVYDALQVHHSVMTAAVELGCSRAYIYKVLKAAGLTPAEAIKGLAIKDHRSLSKGDDTGGR